MYKDLQYTFNDRVNRLIHSRLLVDGCPSGMRLFQDGLVFQKSCCFSFESFFLSEGSLIVYS